jgi:hypothetical protein
VSPADPRITAYADGALSPQDSSRVEKELASDPAARAELDDIRALQQSLREAFAGGQAAGWGRLPMRVAPRPRRFRFRNLVVPLLAAACIGLVAGAFTISEIGMAREKARRSVDAANLRQIGLACRVFSGAHGDRLPVATDIWDFARQLAVGGGLTEGAVWLTESESVGRASWGLDTVLTPDGKRLAPAFTGVRPSFAVLLSGLGADAPATTPVAWTRGLRPDGRWAPDSPYGGEGGHVVFIDGNVTFFRRIDGAFARFDGTGSTSNILEALPPGARIGEAAPPPDGE